MRVVGGLRRIHCELHRDEHIAGKTGTVKLSARNTFCSADVSKSAEHQDPQASNVKQTKMNLNSLVGMKSLKWT